MESKNPKELTEIILQSIVENPDDISVLRTTDNMGVLLTVNSNPKDKGLIIGVHGQNMRAIRWVARICGLKHKETVFIKVQE